MQDVEQHQCAVVVCVGVQNETGDPVVASEVPRFSLWRRGRAARASVVFAASAWIMIAAAVQLSTPSWMRVGSSSSILKCKTWVACKEED